VKVQPQVFTAKCSEPQVGISNGMYEGSGVAKFLSLRVDLHIPVTAYSQIFFSAFLTFLQIGISCCKLIAPFFADSLLQKRS